MGGVFGGGGDSGGGQAQQAAEQFSKYNYQAQANALESIKNVDTSYPEFVSSSTFAPGMQDYYKYQTPDQMAKVNDLGYVYGLTNGDYDRLEQALAYSGAQAAKSAYTQGSNNLANAMGAQGLYGSSIMGKQSAENVTGQYINAMQQNAAQAAQQRYQMQQSDVNAYNAFNLQNYQNQVAQNQALYSAGFQNTNALNQYLSDQNQFQLDQTNKQIDWANSQLAQQYQYELERKKYADMQRQQMTSNYINLGTNNASAISSLYGASTAAQSQKYASDQQAQSSTLAAAAAAAAAAA